MSWKTKAAVAGTVAALTIGGMNAIQDVRDPASAERPGTVGSEQLSDADERRTDQQRDKLGDGVNAEGREAIRPGEHRPHVKVRLP